jgi:hypothetical protein
MVNKKRKQRAQFKLISEFCSNLETNHEFYVKRLEKFKKDPDSKNLYKGAQEMIEVQVEIMRACYEVSKNPIFLWRAFSNCVDGKLKFPQWIINYFYKSALNIVKAADDYESSQREKDLLSNALNFRSSGNVNNFSEWNNILQRLKSVSEVMRQKTTSDLTFEEIEARVAYNIEPNNEQKQTKIERNLKRWRQALQKIPKDLDLG